MHEREARLIADRVIAPDFGDIDRVLRSEPARDVDAAGRYIEVKGNSGAAQMRPLCHRFEVIDRFRRFDFDRSLEFSPAWPRRQDEIRKNLDLPDPYRHGLVFTNVRRYVVASFQLYLEDTNHTVVLELLADGPHENWAHLTSRRRQYPEIVFLRNANFTSDTRAGRRPRADPRGVQRLTYNFCGLRMIR